MALLTILGGEDICYLEDTYHQAADPFNSIYVSNRMFIVTTHYITLGVF